MIGDKAAELMKDLIRNKTDLLPKYRQDLVDAVLQEMNTLFELNSKDANKDNPELFCVVKVRHTALQWNKRCLIAYHLHRLEILKKFRWEFGAVLPQEIRSNLSDTEILWFSHYCGNLANYMGKLNDGKGVDLTQHMKAPKRLYIQVRCLMDYGDYELEDGTSIVLTKDSTHYLPVSQCEKLIQQGILEQVIN